MHIAALGITNTTNAGGLSAALGGGEHFSRLLELRDAASDRAAKPHEEAARDAARDLVSVSLVQPLLEEARRDPFQSDLFHGGQTEDAFGAQLDTIFAERITSSSGFSVVDAVYRQITRGGVQVDTAG